MAVNVLISIINITLFSSALFSSYKLFKDHRAPSVGFFLVGVSAGLYIFPSSTTFFTSLQKDAECAAEVLAPVLLAFHFLWLSEDRNTAFVLLCVSCLLLGLCDRFSTETFTVLCRCIGLASLSCCLMVCLLAGNLTGVLTSLAVNLPVLLAPPNGQRTFSILISPTANELNKKWLLKISMAIGCLTSKHSLDKLQLDVADRYHLYL